MNKEDKELLLKYLCMALPYDCMVTIAEGGIDGLQWDNVTLNSYLLYQIEEEDGLEYIKPYLRPMSSMTGDELKELKKMQQIQSICSYHTISMDLEFINWYLAHHFDINHLIDRGLAIEVTKENNPYENGL